MTFFKNKTKKRANSASSSLGTTCDDMERKYDVDLVEDVDQNDIDSDNVVSFLGMSGQKLHNAISVMAGMGFLLFGYDQGVMGSLLTLPSFYGTFTDMDTSSRYINEPQNSAQLSQNSTWQGFVVAVYELGCLAGAIAVMGIGDKLGRRRTIFVGCIIMIIGAVIQAASYSSGQLVAARIITGIGNGMNTSTVPVWQSECAKPEHRGKLVMVQGSLVSAGVMISYWIDFAFYFLPNSSASWRFPLAFQILFPLTILPFILKLPESPRWLLKADRGHEAARVFSALDKVPLNHPIIHTQINEILESLHEEDSAVVALEDVDGNSAAANGTTIPEINEKVRYNSSRRSLRLMCTQGKLKYFHRSMLGFVNQMCQQICGINLITYYAATIMENYIHMSALNSRIIAACNGTEYFLASWIAFWTIERFGRRKLMIIGAAAQAVTMAVLTGTVWRSDAYDDTGAGIAAVVFLFVFNTFFAVGWLGMSWLYPAEVTPLAVRAPANGLSTAANWIFNFMVVMITPVAFDSIGAYTYTIFAAINLLMVPTVYFFFPETAGRSLEEMDKVFEQSNVWTPWDVVFIEHRMPRQSTGATDATGYEIA